MTKRVYELAQEMSIDKEDLLTEIRKLDIQVANTASILEDEEVARVTYMLSPRLKMTTITEKRIRHNVIRRRVKRPEPPPEPEVVGPEVDQAPDALVAEEVQQEERAPAEAALAKDEAEFERVGGGTPVAKAAPELPGAAEVAKSLEGIAETAKTAELLAPEKEELPAEPQPKSVSIKEKTSAVGIIEKETALPKETPAPEEEELPSQKIEKRKEVVPGEAIKAPRKTRETPSKAKRKKRGEKVEPARILGRVELPREPAARIAPTPRAETPDQSHPTRETAETQRDKDRRKRPIKTEQALPPAPLPVPEKTGKKKAFRKKKEVVKKKDLYEEKGRAFHLSRKEERKIAARKTIKKTEITTPKAIKRRIKVYDTISVGELAKRLQIKATDLIKELMKMGVMASINKPLDIDIATLVSAEFGYEVESASMEPMHILETQADRPEELVARSPVVTVMGHVDHGKTALLDAIRHTHVMEGEAGGITQHIGAYTVRQDGNKIVFIDTPGHEAFTAMRARGAKVTDIVVLVVAADDGVMAQTDEAIAHARAANVPIVVAINKIDKPNANLERVRKSLAERELIPEEWGGDVLFTEVSAKEKIGIDQLLENILLQAEILDYKANPSKPARGVVIESRMERGRGAVASILVQEGTLRPGDYFITGVHTGRVRALLDENGQMLTHAPPSTPVEVQGFSGVPAAGEEFVVVTEEKRARELVEYRQQKQRESELARSAKITLETFYSKMQEGEAKELNLVLKADTQGSLEALSEALINMSTDKVKTHIIHGSVGTVTENDVMLASASKAIIVGFQVKSDPRTLTLAEHEGVQIQHYNIIYNAIDEIHKAMKGLLEPVIKEVHLGRAEVRHLFSISRVGLIAGCTQLEGIARRGAVARIIRDQQVVHEGKVTSLKRFKDDVREVSVGFEFGLLIDGSPEFQIKDLVDFFEYTEEEDSL
ncbi:MAG: translation initiation factor IF-2 [Deltaproteobacteria bacterium]|nr:translation initiation factor IF-2 [Deltaproteobacteria bacterium]